MDREESQDSDLVAAAAVLRIMGAVDDYLYTNEHCADGTRRSIFSGPNREKLMGGQPPPGTDPASEWERLIHPDDWDAHLAHRDRLRRGEPSEVRYRLCGYDGVVRWIEARTRSVHADGRVFVDGVVSDVTRQVEAERRARARARGARAPRGGERARRAPRRADPTRQPTQAPAAVGPSARFRRALADGALRPRRLQALQRHFGHPAGDALLVRLASRLAAAMPEDSAFRLGGDEFLVLTPADGDVEALLSAAARALPRRATASRSPPPSVPSSFPRRPPTRAARSTSATSGCTTRVPAAGPARPPAGRAARGPRCSGAEPWSCTRRTSRSLRSPLAPAYASIWSRRSSASSRPPCCTTSARSASATRSWRSRDHSLPMEWNVRPSAHDHRRAVLEPRRPSATSRRSVRATHDFDGTGYPDGLAGPTRSRWTLGIVSACDAYSAMTSDRSYRAPLSPGEAIAELARHAGSQFDPEVVEVLAAVAASAIPKLTF